MTLDSNHLQQYQTIRKELLDITDFLLADSRLDDECRQKLEQFKETFERDYFYITLVSGFQSGKSTTLNVIAGGREISPTGEGAKTSACIVEIFPIKKTEKEYAEVHWKNKCELLDYINEHLKLAINDLDDQQDFDAFISILNQKKQHINISNDETDHLHILAIIAYYYSSFKNKPQKERMTIAQAQKLIKFPEKFTIKSAEEITEQEASFVFIKSVRFYIYSEQLLENGIVFIDCPGIGISAYDTRVTDNILKDVSNAVVYILGDTKAMSQYDKHYLNHLKKLNLIDRTFLAINVVNQSLKQRRKIFEENDKPILNNICELKDDHVGFYHARLALLSNFYHRLGALSQFEIDSLYEKIKSSYGCELPRDKKSVVEHYVKQSIIDDYKLYKKKNIFNIQQKQLVKDDISDVHRFFSKQWLANNFLKFKQIINNYYWSLRDAVRNIKLKYFSVQQKDYDIFYANYIEYQKQNAMIDNQLDLLLKEDISDWNILYSKILNSILQNQSRIKLMNNGVLMLKQIVDSFYARLKNQEIIIGVQYDTIKEELEQSKKAIEDFYSDTESIITDITAIYSTYSINEQFIDFINKKTEIFIQELYQDIKSEIERQCAEKVRHKKIAKYIKQEYIAQKLKGWISIQLSDFVSVCQKNLLDAPVIESHHINNLLKKYKRFQDSYDFLITQTYFQEYNFFDQSIDEFNSSIKFDEFNQGKIGAIIGTTIGIAFIFFLYMSAPSDSSGNLFVLLFWIVSLCWIGKKIGTLFMTKKHLYKTFSKDMIEILIENYLKISTVINGSQQIVAQLKQKIVDTFISQFQSEIDQMKNELIATSQKQEEYYKKLDDERRIITEYAINVRKQLIEPIQRQLDDIIEHTNKIFPSNTSIL